MECASIIDAIQAIDQNVTLFMNHAVESRFSDTFWMFMSDKSVWIPAYAICCFYLVKRLGWKRALVIACAVALSFGVCDQLSGLVKHSVARLRPVYSQSMLAGGLNVLEKGGGRFGFFSAHAANSFAFTTCLILGFRYCTGRKYTLFEIFATLWALLVSISRIFVGKHYLGDVLAGIVIGIFTGYLVTTGASLLLRRLALKREAAKAELKASAEDNLMKKVKAKE